MVMTHIEKVSAAEVAHWYPFAVIRQLEDGLRYVHSVHETYQEAEAEAERATELLSNDQHEFVFKVMLVDQETEWR